MASMENNFDFIIIGSGFGGSVSALRLAQKGYKVAVLEKGRRYAPSDFAKTNWNLRKFLWAPSLRLFGIQQITFLKGVMALHGVGVGGGSLVYANTLMKPQDEVFLQWPKGVNWKDELAPGYEKAKKILGVTVNRFESISDRYLQKLGHELGIADTYHLTEVGVYFGTPGETVPDPYFAGEGPARTGCNACGACMVGCRVGAKNTLDKNYLYFAEKWGAKILDSLHVDQVLPEGGRYKVTAKRTDRIFSEKTVFTADRVIFAAGVLGTLEILFKNKYSYGHLSKISEKLGKMVRTNGESLCGATQTGTHEDLSVGIAIGSAIHPDKDTKIEPVRYPAGSDAMKFLAVPLTGPGNRVVRPIKMLCNLVLKAPTFIKIYFFSDWSKKGIILLVMKSIDQTLEIKWRRTWMRLFQKHLTTDLKGQNVPSYMPIAQKASTLLAKIVGGVPQNVVSEVVMGTPATAHMLGGCSLSDIGVDSVINQWHELQSYPGLYVCDGSVIPSNLGVNPSLTISALAERFATQFPLASGMTNSEFERRCNII
ncbi:GMC family oxidoreductase [Bdellovibrio sp.]|uniref:GMC family oxidoreductase n=1 Tax=Bdellovibrio sp. TaxID=28201 RepID=UPI0032221A73